MWQGNCARRIVVLYPDEKDIRTADRTGHHHFRPELVIAGPCPADPVGLEGAGVLRTEKSRQIYTPLCLLQAEDDGRQRSGRSPARRRR